MHQCSLIRPRANVAVATRTIDSRSLTARLVAFIMAVALLIAFYPSSSSGAESENIRLAKGMSNAYAEVVEKVGPAVVGIETEKIIKNDSNSHDAMGMEDMFEQFFGPRGFGGPSPRPRQSPQSEERRIPSLGSGVIIDDKGHILTNNHVVADADTIKVELANEKGKTFKAEIVGRDPNSDVAIIKLIDPPANLPIARLGDSDAMKPGNIVIAIGAPLGFKQSITAGIISALSRTLGEFSYERFIQTDAAINQGNSGGPLLNLDGEVIGINTIISTAGGRGSIGIGFAIPTSLAKPIITQLIEKGSVTRGYVGIVMNPDDQDVSREMGHDGTGVVVVDVAPNGPAEKAGLQPGDLITTLNGVAIRDNDHLRYMVAESTPDTVMAVTVLRNGEEVRLTITIEAQPEDMFSRARTGGGRSGPSGGAERTRQEESKELGVTVQNIDDTLRQRYNLSANVEGGVVVTKVDAGSDAAERGVRVGAVIQEIDRRPIADVESFRKVMEDVKDRDKVMVSLRFGEVSRFVMIKIQK